MSSRINHLYLGDIAKIKGGKRLPAGASLQPQKNSHPYIRVRDMGQIYIPRDGLEYVPDDVFPSIKNYIVEENDVIISIVGTIGAVSIIDRHFHLASQTENCAKLSGLDHEDAVYLYYYLISSYGQQQIKAGTVGAVQPKLPLYNIAKLEIYWPEKNERKRVVNYLKSLDDKIELNRQINQTLEQIAQAMFKSWFVDFEPTHAKIAAKEAGGDQATIEQAAMCAISGKTPDQLNLSPPETLAQLKATAALFPDTLVDSELGDIPEGWEVGTVGDLFELHRGYDLPAIDRKDGTYPVFAASGFHGFHSEFKIEPPGIITGRSGVIGNVYLSLSRYWPLNTTLYVREFKKCGPYFAFFFLSRCDLKSINSGSAVPSLNRNFVHSLPCSIPTNALDQCFENFAKKTFEEINAITRQNELLSTIRDALLPKLLSGEVVVA